MPVSPETFERMVAAFGPGGAVLLLLCGGLFFFYRRDHLRKQHGLREAHERRDRREERLIVVIGELTETTGNVQLALNAFGAAIDRLAKSLDETERNRTREFDRLARLLELRRAN